MRNVLFCFALAIVAATAQAQDATAARGEYIVRNAAVCGHCHAANRKNPDGALSGGTEFRNWRVGVARASNLTPDVETGLGAWSEEEIVRSLRNGVRRDGRLLIPVMPYEWMHEMSDADALAVARYLKSQPPVRNAVRQSPSLFFKIGKIFFLRPLPARSITANPHDGAYLAQHVALCADCHTPRSGIRQASDKRRLFAGMAKPPKGFPANPSNLTPDMETGIGKWSEADFIRTLRTGVTPEGRKLHPFMPREVGRMTDADLHSIYVYLRALPPIRNSVPRVPMPPQTN